MTKQIRLSNKLIKQLQDMVIIIHFEMSRNSGSNTSLCRAVDIAMTKPEDIMLVLLVVQAYYTKNLNDLTRLQSYLVEKYNFDLLRPYKEL